MWYERLSLAAPMTMPTAAATSSKTATAHCLWSLLTLVSCCAATGGSGWLGSKVWWGEIAVYYVVRYASTSIATANQILRLRFECQLINDIDDNNNLSITHGRQRGGKQIFTVHVNCCIKLSHVLVNNKFRFDNRQLNCGGLLGRSITWKLIKL